MAGKHAGGQAGSSVFYGHVTLSIDLLCYVSASVDMNGTPKYTLLSVLANIESTTIYSFIDRFMCTISGSGYL